MYALLVCIYAWKNHVLVRDCIEEGWRERNRDRCVLAQPSKNLLLLLELVEVDLEAVENGLASLGDVPQVVLGVVGDLRLEPDRAASEGEKSARDVADGRGGDERRVFLVLRRLIDVLQFLESVHHGREVLLDIA